MPDVLPCVNKSDDDDDDDDDEGAGEGGKIEIREILSTATSTQSPTHKTNKKKTTLGSNSVNKPLDRRS